MAFVKKENLDHHMDPQSVHDIHTGDYLQQTAQSTQSSITAFLAKLWALVNDPSCDDLICWDASGVSFHVYDQSRFAREVLPRYFKHNNFASFIRQLNMYGFRKMSTIEHGSLKNERDDIEFAHAHFLRGQESLLELIKRRAPDHQQKSTVHPVTKPSNVLVSTNTVDNKSTRPIELNRLIDDVKNLQSKQSSLTDKLSYVQSENQALWSELSSLRQKHNKQQQIVSKLVEFLLTFFAQHSHSRNTRSVQQAPTGDIITNQSFSSQYHQPHSTSQSAQLPDSTSMTLDEDTVTPLLLKRKQPILMIEEEPHKRLASDKKLMYLPVNAPRQPTVTINELTDTDLSSWLKVGDDVPLVDLVPSPPPALSQTHFDVDDHLNHQRQPKTNAYRWSNPNVGNQCQTIMNPLNNNLNHSTVNNPKNTFIPDFILQTDSDQLGKQADFGLANNEVSLADIKTSQTSGFNRNGLKLMSTEKPADSSNIILNNVSSVDDITGDVDHIQSSLENIRDLMFESLPEDTRSIDSLFDEENELLLPLLTPAETPTDQSAPPSMKPDMQLVTNANSNLPPSSQPISSMDDQLFERFLHGSNKIEEQRHTINQLEREKADLQTKIHQFEQRKSQRK